jgi:hypothetical protein
MLSIICVSSAKANNVYDGDDQIKKSVEKYAKDSLEKKYKDYKVITTSIVNTTTVKDFIKQDSMILSNFINNKVYAMSLPMYKIGIKQNVTMRKSISPKTIDYGIAKMYDKTNLKIENIMKELVLNSKKLKLNENIYTVTHIFNYKDSNSAIICDTAMFIHAPTKIRLFSNATKFDKGLNFTGTIKSYKKGIKEMLKEIKPDDNK